MNKYSTFCKGVSFMATLCVANVAYAADTPTPPRTISVGVTAGTLGAGPEIAYRPLKKLGLRANAAFFNFSHQVDSDGVIYDGKLDLTSFGAAVDFYPFGGHFRVSGGVRVNKNKIKLTATPTGPVEVGDTTYTPAQIGTLTGSVTTASVAPMATLGWGGALTKGVTFGFDAGVMFQGAPRVNDLAVSSNSVVKVTRADIVAEENKINDEVNKFNVYPVVQFSLGYAF
jgi:hypothetical protein